MVQFAYAISVLLSLFCGGSAAFYLINGDRPKYRLATVLCLLFGLIGYALRRGR